MDLAFLSLVRSPPRMDTLEFDDGSESLCGEDSAQTGVDVFYCTSVGLRYIKDSFAAQPYNIIGPKSRMKLLS